MWGTTSILVKRNLKIIFANKKFYISPLNNLVLERFNSTNKSVPNATIDKSFQEKEFLKQETLDQRGISRKVKFVFALLGLSITIAGAYIFMEIQKSDEDGSEIPAWKQYLKRLLKQIENITVFIQEPSREKLLPDVVSYPYYQPPYTLILEFTDVLAHPDWTYNTGWRFKKRPGLDYMLENLVGLYEIVVFTAEPGMTIFPVIDALDPKNLISYKLVRDSTHFVDGHHVKNLDKLNRDLSKVIVVDWNTKSIKFHPDNHLHVNRWRGDNDDSALIDLTSFLKTIAHTEIEDVREVLRFYKQYDDPLAEFHKKQMQYYEENREQKQEQPRLPRNHPKSNTVFDYFIHNIPATDLLLQDPISQHLDTPTGITKSALKKKKKSKLIGKAKKKLKQTSDINIKKRISKFTNKINLKSDDTINLINSPPNKIKKGKGMQKDKTSSSIKSSHLSEELGFVKKHKNKNNHSSLLTDSLDTPDGNIKKVKKRKQKLKKLQTNIDKTAGSNIQAEEVVNLLKTPATSKKLNKNKTSQNSAQSENAINKEKSNKDQNKQSKKYKKEFQQEITTAANYNILTKSKKRRMKKLEIIMNKDKFSGKNNEGSVAESKLIKNTRLKEQKKKHKVKLELLEAIPEGTKKLKSEFEKQVKKIKINKKVQSPKENLIATETPSRIIRDKKKEKFFEKLKDVLKEVKEKKPELSLRQKMMGKLKAARFRFINEQIYTTDSKEAQKLFQDDPGAFKAYHDGYRKQVKSWPLNPLDAIIQSIKKMPKTHIVVDFGCGDARLSKSVNQKVHSFDLVAVDDTVIECDMSKVPLENSSVDVAVFCLSLMGTNLRDYLLEANRVLKVGGVLKIAEVESRFENIDDFVKGVGYFGFKNTVKDLTNNLFYFLDFKKERPVKHKNKLPTIGLLPCLYKRR